jgi:hypothetical protein
MANLDSTKFNQLLSEGKTEEAKQLLRDFIDSEWTKDDDGEYYVGLITEYINKADAINEVYLDELKNISRQLQELDDISNVTEKNAALGKIRDDIAKL